MSPARSKLALASCTLAGILLAAADPGHGDPAPKAPPANAEAVTPPADTKGLDAGLQSALDAAFDRLLRKQKAWSTSAVYSLYHWSKDLMTAQGKLLDDWRDVEAAEQAHRNRMERLNDAVQRLQGPNRDELIEACRDAVLRAKADRISGPFPPDEPATPRPKAKKATVALRAAGAISPPMGPAVEPGGDLQRREYERRLRLLIPGLAEAVEDADQSPGTRAILRKLNEPIAMNFPDKVVLEDVLRYIKEATRGPGDPGITIYVDPRGLKEAGATMESPVALDLTGVPLKTTLRLLLRQLGLAYCVKDGLLIISSVEGVYQELIEAESANEPDAPKKDGAP
jgi:hypothetical protein